MDHYGTEFQSNFKGLCSAWTAFLATSKYDNNLPAAGNQLSPLIQLVTLETMFANYVNILTQDL